MSRSPALDPNEMDLDAVINGILAMSPPTLGGHERAEVNLRRLGRPELNEAFRRLRTALEHTVEHAEAAKIRHDALRAGKGASASAPGVRGLARLRSVRDTIRAERVERSRAETPSAIEPTIASPGRGDAARADEAKESVYGSPGRNGDQADMPRGRSATYAASIGDIARSDWGDLPLTSGMASLLAARLSRQRAEYVEDDIVDIAASIDDLQRAFDAELERHKLLDDEFLRSMPISTFVRSKLFSMVRDLTNFVGLEALRPGTPATLAAVGFVGASHLAGRARLPRYGTKVNLIVESRPVLDDRKAVEGLARLSAVTAEYAPDVIVCLSTGGAMIGKFLVGQMKDATNTRIVKVDVARDERTSTAKKFRAAARVLVIDDVVASADGMTSARDWVTAVAPTATCQALALVSSVGAMKHLDMDWMYSYAVAPSVTIDLPWDSAGTYRQTQQGHVFGYGRPRNLPIANEVYERIAEDIRAPTATFD